MSEAEIRADIDRRFFDNYAKTTIHDQMLADKVRMTAYEAAIAKTVRGKVVIDVGAGTGALSLMAARAGARRVEAVEKSGIVSKARD